MSIFTLGIILDTIGTVFIGLAVLMVHRHVSRERKIDMDVLRAMRKERLLTISGIFLVVIGAALQALFH